MNFDNTYDVYVGRYITYGIRPQMTFNSANGPESVHSSREFGCDSFTDSID